MALGQLNLHIEKMNLNLYCTQKVTKKTLDLNIKAKTGTLLKEFVGAIFVPLG